jgi:hypothetical protein
MIATKTSTMRSADRDRPITHERLPATSGTQTAAGRAGAPSVRASLVGTSLVATGFFRRPLSEPLLGLLLGLAPNLLV